MQRVYHQIALNDIARLFEHLPDPEPKPDPVYIVQVHIAEPGDYTIQIDKNGITLYQNDENEAEVNL